MPIEYAKSGWQVADGWKVGRVKTTWFLSLQLCCDSILSLLSSILRGSVVLLFVRQHHNISAAVGIALLYGVPYAASKMLLLVVWMHMSWRWREFLHFLNRFEIASRF